MKLFLSLFLAVSASLLATQTARSQVAFVVNSTVDPGDGTCDASECTFREAITAANATATRDSIHFEIPGAGVQTIVLDSQLPTVTERAVIDGYTQPGASPNTLAIGSDAVLLIEIDASAASAGLVLGGSVANSTILRGLVINRAQSFGILTNGFSIFILGNYIGIDPTGSMDRGNNVGIQLTHNGATNIRIGGTDPADRNVISGNGDAGIRVTGNPALAPPSEFIIEGNYIGTDAGGTEALGNTFDGIAIGHGTNARIGGTEPGAGNIVSANGRYGIILSTSTNSGTLVSSMTVQGNFIGADATGTSALGNGLDGVHIDVTGGHVIGGSEGGAGNVISHNSGDGINVNGAVNLVEVEGNVIGSNGGDGVFIYASWPAYLLSTKNVFGANGGLAVNLACSGNSTNDGSTSNDTEDADGGPNECQNYPDIASSGVSGGAEDLVITYSVDTAPANATYPLTVEFFRAESASEAEGVEYLGSDTYTESDWTGSGTSPGTKQANLGNAAALGMGEGNIVVATATTADGYTSEFTMPTSVVVSNEAGPELPQEVTVEMEAYPNPLNGNGTVVLDVPRSQSARLVVYDLLGREVAVLHDGRLEKGRQTLSMSGSDWAAGSYMLRLVTEDGVQSTPLVLVR